MSQAANRPLADRMILGYLLALTIFISAFLLFQVQPLISKFILPWFGGSPAVWTTAMLFFQCTLFLGYVYSHLLFSRLSLVKQVRVHVVLLGLASIMANCGEPAKASIRSYGTNRPPRWRLTMLRPNHRLGASNHQTRRSKLSMLRASLSQHSFPQMGGPRRES